MDEVASPIFVIGAARSGTHLLATTLADNLDVVYTGELNELWKRYIPPLSHDVIPASMATADVKREMRAAFSSLLEDGEGQVLMEKTPANVYRLPFIAEVFPEARFVYIVRDGRDVAVSARRKYRGDYRKVTKMNAEEDSFLERMGRLRETVTKKLRYGLKPGHLAANAGRYASGVLSILGMKGTRAWGPRFPGQTEYMASHSLLVVASIQWRLAVISAESFFTHRPDKEVVRVRYEELLSQPERTIQRVVDELDERPKAERIVHQIKAGGSTWRDELSIKERVSLSVLLSHVLEEQGYALDNEVRGWQ